MYQYVTEVISGRRTGVLARLVLIPLLFASLFYSATVRLRILFYRWEWFASYPVPPQVIAVGNITTGGSGKTPIVEYIARHLAGSDLAVAILSRGYHALDETGVNDEYMVLRDNLPDVPHFTGSDRVARACHAHKEGAEVLVLDDGYQHVRIRRDLNILLIDGLQPFGGGRVLPAGLLREPLSAINRADLVIITRANQVDDAALARIEEKVGQYTDVPRLLATIEVAGLEEVTTGETVAVDVAQDMKVLAFCAIGNPPSFQSTLEELGFEVVALESFPDHHHYTDNDLARLEQQAGDRGATALVCTQKDGVKLRSLSPAMALYQVNIGAHITRGKEELEQRLDEVVARPIR